MGIHGLTKLLADNAPDCIKSHSIETFFGRKIAVDASMHIYQFMIMVGRVGDQQLNAEDGTVTSHLQGMFYRTAKMLDYGIKPVFVFDGKAPELKRKLLDERGEKRGEASDALQLAKDEGNAEDVEKYSKRNVRVTREHNEECKRLLQLMGIPTVDAASEAEAQCAEMCKADLVWGVATEDMDALTFGCPRLVRHMMGSTAQTEKQPIMVFEHDKALEGLGLTNSQFIDFCIMCGCDYAPNIKGIGPVTALKMIKTHGGMEALLAHLEGGKHHVPENWPWKEAHAFFTDPDVVKAQDIPPLKWNDPDEEGLVQFLVNEKSFAEDRVRKVVARIRAAKGKAQQGRIESFFKPTGVTTNKAKPAPAGKDVKRKEGPAAKSGPAAKKGKLGGVGGGKKK
mmetsp:Transcript_12685/g.22442  ORF Transcript_12685/g.22442 Transcript_12685/m.22442 type:complete len:396 (+) Transcript_12685:78-1265(+)